MRGQLLLQPETQKNASQVLTCTPSHELQIFSPHQKLGLESFPPYVFFIMVIIRKLSVSPSVLECPGEGHLLAH